MNVGLPPMGEQDVLGQPFYRVVGEDDKLLVGGRVDKELAAFLLEDSFHAHRHLDGMA